MDTFITAALESGLLYVALLVVAVVIVWLVISTLRANSALRRKLEDGFGQMPELDNKLDSIARYWQLKQRHDEAEHGIDDKTWDDPNH
jgi:uncharacterized protein YoxC